MSSAARMMPAIYTPVSLPGRKASRPRTGGSVSTIRVYTGLVRDNKYCLTAPGKQAVAVGLKRKELCIIPPLPPSPAR